jgi:acid phosphatase class B
MRAWIATSMIILAVLGAGGCGTEPTETTAQTEPTIEPQAQAQRRVGFDVDDTLLFSSPAFDVAYATEGVEPRSDEFWTIVNSSDEGNSEIKQKTRELLEAHRAAGDEIYVITARHPPGGDGLRAFLQQHLGIEPDHVFFETEGKGERIRALGLQVFYGDSDSDIAGAIEGGATGIRILRSPRSSYKKKYNPGRYNEEIIEGSEG